MDKRQKSSKAKPKKPNRPRRPGNEVAFWDAEREDITSGRQSGKKSLPRVLKKRGKANSKKTAVSDQREIASGDTVGKKAFWRSLASRAYIAGAIIVVTAALVWAFTAFFTVGEINVYGNSKHTKEEIIELSGVDYGDSLLLLSKSKIKNGIVGDSLYIEDVTVRRLFPDTVEITVTDKTVAYAFEANGAYWIASGTGTLLDLTLSRPAGS
ncbi:MAG: FtsQ-type POTRA domain-containing protein, partial [Clostridia bacterium]|nr:FtsQ-type POTRA domain-containing protein [Clostridia bacterium]